MSGRLKIEEREEKREDKLKDFFFDCLIIFQFYWYRWYVIISDFVNICRVLNTYYIRIKGNDVECRRSMTMTRSQHDSQRSKITLLGGEDCHIAG